MAPTETERRHRLDTLGVDACASALGRSGRQTLDADDAPLEPDRPLDRRRVVLRIVVGVADDGRKVDLAPGESASQVEHIGKRQGRCEGLVAHLLARFLDAARELDFTFAPEERDASHLVEVVAHWVGRRRAPRRPHRRLDDLRGVVVDSDRERLFFELRLDDLLARCRAVLDELDLERTEQRENVVDIFGADRVGWQEAIHFVEGEEAFGLSELNDLLHFFERANLHGDLYTRSAASL